MFKDLLMAMVSAKALRLATDAWTQVLNCWVAEETARTIEASPCISMLY